MTHSYEHARIVDHTYHSSGRRFYTVQCDTCGIVLNSGHHYVEGLAHLADELAERHNAEVHAPAPTTADL